MKPLINSEVPATQGCVAKIDLHLITLLMMAGLSFHGFQKQKSP